MSFSCGVCREESDRMLRCSRCHSKMYCSVDCQKKDYKKHVDHCKIVGSLPPWQAPERIDQLSLIQCIEALVDIAIRDTSYDVDCDPFHLNNKESPKHQATIAIARTLFAHEQTTKTEYMRMALGGFGVLLRERVPSLPSYTVRGHQRCLSAHWDGIGHWHD